MHDQARALLNQAAQRARLIPAARTEDMRRALIARVLFDLRAALATKPPKERNGAL